MFNIPLCTSDIFFCMKSDIYPVNILLLPLCTKKGEKKRKNILYFDQENDAWEAFHYRVCSLTEGAAAEEEPQCPLQDGRGSIAKGGRAGLK